MDAVVTANAVVTAIPRGALMRMAAVLTANDAHGCGAPMHAGPPMQGSPWAPCFDVCSSEPQSAGFHAAADAKSHANKIAC